MLVHETSQRYCYVNFYTFRCTMTDVMFIMIMHSPISIFITLIIIHNINCLRTNTIKKYPSVHVRVQTLVATNQTTSTTTKQLCCLTMCFYLSLILLRKVAHAHSLGSAIPNFRHPLPRIAKIPTQQHRYPKIPCKSQSVVLGERLWALIMVS